MPQVDWNQVATTVISAVISALIIGFLSWLGLPEIGWRSRSKDRRFLHGIAVKRTEGVEIRNQGLKPLAGAALSDWRRKAAEWETGAAAEVARFSKAEGERLRTLGDVPVLSVAGVSDPEQLRLLRNLTETLKRMDALLERNLPQAR